MKILKSILFILLFTIILTGCSNVTEEQDKLKEKIVEEIAYIDTKIVDMLNQLNNIILQNYQMTSKEIELSKEAEASQSIETEGENSEAQSSSQAQNTEENSLEISELSEGNILNNDKTEIKWDKIKTDIELINTSWNIMLLDIYRLNQSSNNINGFTSALNNCIISIDNEDKISTIINLSDLYAFLPKFLNDISSQEEIKSIKQTKSYILYAYSFANQSDWTRAREEMSKAEEEFNKIMNSTEFTKNKENKINSVYIGIKELQNALNTEEIKVFFINYRNLIERINIL